MKEAADIQSAAERLWKRLTQLEADHEECAGEAAANFFTWPEFVERAAAHTQLTFQELQLGADAPHISSRPSLTFGGNMQVAVAEAKNFVEQGYRVAFYAPSNGELERLADVLREYSVPFTLGLAPNEAATPYLAERSYLAGPVASTYLVKGLVRRGTVFPDSKIAFIGSEDLFGASDLVPHAPGINKGAASAFAADIASTGLLIADVRVFDVYRGKGVDEGFKSVALEVVIQPREATLAEAEIEALTAKVVAAVEKQGGKLRA